jgi:hypothetical protein
MSTRLRLYDLRLSDLPTVSGLCQADVNGVASVVNSVQRRLIYGVQVSEEGWAGTFAEVAFNVNPCSPYITTPRGISRLEAINVCRRPVALRNQFYEYLRFGNGRMPKLCCNPQLGNFRGGCLEVYSRNNAVTFVDPPTTPFLLRIYPANPDDATANSRVLIQGVDLNGNTIYSQDGTNQITGEFVTLESPFVQFTSQLNQITGIQKDITVGNLQFKSVNPDTGEETLLLTMEPGEQTAWYRRYYLNRLPPSCCPEPITPTTTVQVTAIAKLELIPVVVDTDYTLITGQAGIEAMIEEAQAMKYSRIDEASAKLMAREHHANAIKILNSQLTDLYGIENNAIEVAIFGSARLARQSIGTMI